MSIIEVSAPHADEWDWPLQHNDGVVKVLNTQDKFEVGLDAAFFTPKEIEVKVLNNNLMVSCRHESRSDKHGDIKREVFRTYHLPDDIDVKTLKSSIGPNGVLTIAASKKK